jgi:signal peptidase II
MNPRRIVIFVVVLVIAVALDQGSKAWARDLPVPAGCTVAAMKAHYCGGIPQSVIHGFWDWELAYNDGAAFSNFRGKQVVLSVIAFGALIAIGFMAWRTRPEQGIKRLALALIAGGALGNLIDRVRDGAVVDFVRWRAGDHLWPIFNVADVALVVGVGLLIVEGWLVKRAVPAPAS